MDIVTFCQAICNVVAVSENMSCNYTNLRHTSLGG